MFVQTILLVYKEGKDHRAPDTETLVKTNHCRFNSKHASFGGRSHLVQMLLYESQTRSYVRR